MISKYVVNCLFCEENRDSRHTVVTVAASSNFYALQKVETECKRRFGKGVLLETEIIEMTKPTKKES
ncbi:hypothetical protein BAMA_03585 [Bacillus manliponensis]|uniref:DUF3903 domain-containing protein n=1 Tax=Bacillus manliponensis TaxID=574376 RepID=A0A073K9C8_9BACI|nr:DUF3903 domain-containing protein [Bacillus manliponensis]KEK18868.1 hypothetical protein BAMA_03585 [Bacillus manliponensis]